MKILSGLLCALVLSGACKESSFKGGTPTAAADGDALPSTGDSNAIEFGGSAVYRVGNGKATHTSCKESVESHELEGTSYSFQFEVLEDDTNLSFTVGRLCGIDQADSNFISIVDSVGKEPLLKAGLSKQVVEESNPLKPFDKGLNLNKGVYAIKVISERKLKSTDHDDFIIGNIKIQADKAVRGKEIKTEK